MSMKSYSKLIEMYENTFSDKERKFINYVNLNKQNILSTQINELCKKSKCGYSTVYSFFKKVRLSGYKEFLQAINKDLNDQKINDLLVEKFVNNNNFTFESYVSILTTTNNSVSEDNLKKFIFELKQKKNLIFVGFGRSSIIAEYAYAKFSRFGFKSQYIRNYRDDAILTAGNLNPENDLIVFFSISGNTKEIIKIMEIALEKKVRVLSLTSSNSSFVAKNSFVSLLVSDIEGFDQKDLILSPTIGYLYLIDCMIQEIVKQDKDISKRLEIDKSNKEL